jgi:predicted amidophosphoribosyltransferase
VNTEPLALDTVACGRCASPCDLDDNFCRRCGLALGEARLPSVRSQPSLPAVWQPRLRAVVMKGAAFIAAGTLAEVLVRRMVRRALAPLTGSRSSNGKKRAQLVPSYDTTDDAQVVSETFLMRHIRIRR